MGPNALFPFDHFIIMTGSCTLSNFRRLPSSHLSGFTVGLPAYAQLALVFAEPLRQFYRDPRLTTVNRDSSIYRDYPICQLYRDPRLSAVNRDYPIWQLCLDIETFSHLPGLCIWIKSSRPFTGIMQKLMPARAAVGNSIKPPGRYM
jgi:hypothetical protein